MRKDASGSEDLNGRNSKGQIHYQKMKQEVGAKSKCGREQTPVHPRPAAKKKKKSLPSGSQSAIQAIMLAEIEGWVYVSLK